MTKLITATVIAAVALTGAAYGQSVSTRPEPNAATIAQSLSGQGYRVLEIERDDGHYEVKAIASNGQCVELDVHSRSGEVIRSKSDDDCLVASNSSHRRGRGR